MGDSTKAMRESIVDRHLLPAFENQHDEIVSDDLLALCNKVKDGGARLPLRRTSATSWSRVMWTLAV